MEKTILQKLDTMQTQINGIETRIDGMQTQIDGIQTRMGGMQTQIDGIQIQIDGMQIQINDMQIQMNDRFKELNENVTEIRQRQFVFEETYGKKIDAIFDCVTMQMQRNQNKTEEIQELTGRMDKAEIAMLDYDRRLTNLELKR